MTRQAGLPGRQADLAALRMQASLIKLIAKHNFNPDEPRIPAGQPGGGRWTGIGQPFQNGRVGGTLRDRALVLPPQEREKARRAMVLAGVAVDVLGLSKTILPMNIYSSLWSALGDRKQLEQPLYNIRAAAKILKGIAANLRMPAIARIATLYNALGATQVSNYGARVAAVYREKPWLKR